MHAARLLCACALLGAAGLQVAAATGIGKPFTDEMMAERKKAWSLFTALVEPKPPKNVTFPLEEQDDIEFHASREALIEWLKAQVNKYDLQDPHVKKALRDKVVIYQKKTQELILAAIAEGKTLQQARIGMMIAHFESLPWDIQQRGMEQGKHVVTERTTKEALKQGADRALAVHERELAEIRKLKTKAERSAWVKSKLEKSETDVPDFLQEGPLEL